MEYLKFVLAFGVCFLTTLLFSPFVFKLTKKIKAGQTILHYVKEHSQKQGTPTMGGIMFILPAIVISLIFFKTDFLYAVMSLGVFLAYGVLGFLDDFIKVHYKQNLGLRAYQKIIGQLGISLIVAIFVYNTIGTSIYIPFTNQLIDIGFWIIPTVVLIYVATVNSVNLIDGMDGLCSSTSISYLLFFAIILLLSGRSLTGIEYVEVNNLVLSMVCVIGALLAFLIFNVFPAKIFMGDTGSLALGGFIASVSIFSKMELLIPILGLVFVVTTLSDIIQVLYFKKTKKRVFKMAPLHHHFQMSGIHENKIVFCYFIVSFIINLIVCGFYI